MLFAAAHSPTRASLLVDRWGLKLSRFCARSRYVPRWSSSGKAEDQRARRRRRCSHNNQSDVSQLRSDSSDFQIGLVRDPTEVFDGSQARRASCLVLVVISA